MAKKKKRKQTKESPTYLVEIKGIILLLIALIGVSNFGITAKIIKGFSAFLTGVWYIIPLILIGILGVYMIVKRDVPDLISSRLIGLYILIFGILVLTHTGYIDDLSKKGITDFNMLKETINNLMSFLNSGSDLVGGGIIGALGGLILIKLLTVSGTYVVSIVLIIIGAILFTGFSAVDSWKYLQEKHEQNKEKREEKKQEKAIIKESLPLKEEEPKKTIIHDSNEPKPIKEETKEVKEEHKEVYVDSSGYKLPSIDLLNKAKKVNQKQNQDAIKQNVHELEKVLTDFGIDAKVVAANIGPAITQYELEIKSGTKVSRITSLNKEIALELGAKDVRIQAPIPGKKTVGVELPNKVVSAVSLREILEEIPSSKANKKLLVAMGRSIMGNAVTLEINKTPHLLVAGSTGSGKSVCINSMIISILMRTKPDEVKLVLIDPKKVEFSMYAGVPHLLTPVVTDAKKANIVLQKIVKIMEDRYENFEESHTKNIEGYNNYVRKYNEEHPNEKKSLLPFIVVIIDELADLMLVAAKEVEDSIMRITQMARAAGIHLIVATQRPSTNVITGVVKANIPSRISFAVSSNVDSRTILDMSGAEKLIGHGDMLMKPQGENIPLRVQGTFVSDEEIEKVVNYTISQQKAKYDESLEVSDEDRGATTMVEDADEEPLYNEIVDFVIDQGKASTSSIQRRFRLGYNRAARCMDLLEERGIVGPQNGSKPREVLVKKESEGE